MRTVLIALAGALLAADARAICGMEWGQWPQYQGPYSGGIFEITGCSSLPDTQHLCVAVVADDEKLRTVDHRSWTGGWHGGFAINLEVTGYNLWAQGNSRSIVWDTETEDCGRCHKLDQQPGEEEFGFEWRTRANSTHSKAPDGSACADEVHWLEAVPNGFGSAHNDQGLFCRSVVCGDVPEATVWANCQWPDGSANPDPGCVFGYYSFAGGSIPMRLTPDADVNRDEVVGIPDALAVASCFGQAAICNPRADTNQDGVIGVPDYQSIQRNWGRTIIEWTSPLGHAMRRYADLGPCPPWGCAFSGLADFVGISWEPDAGAHDVAEPFE